MSLLATEATLPPPCVLPLILGVLKVVCANFGCSENHLCKVREGELQRSEKSKYDQGEVKDQSEIQLKCIECELNVARRREEKKVKILCRLQFSKKTKGEERYRYGCESGKEIREFNNFIDKTNVKDIPVVGRKYT